MKNTGKSSRNNQNNDTLIYIFLFFLIAMIVGVSVLYHLRPDATRQTTAVIDYKKELGEQLAEPSVKDVSQLLEDSETLEKTIRRALNSKNKNFSSNERAEIQRGLNNSQISLNSIVTGVGLNKLTDEELKTLYSLLYDRGKKLVELKTKVSSGKTYEELRKQMDITQRNWKIPFDERQEIEVQLDKVIRAWYNKFMDKELKREDGSREWEYIEPVLRDGRKASKDSPDDVNYFKTIHRMEEPNGEEFTIDLSGYKPVKITFNGYAGFLTKEDKKGSTEGTKTFGLTLSDPVTSIRTKDENEQIKDEVKVVGRNRRSIIIKLKKKLFFNREGYDEWLTDVYQTEKQSGRNYFDICWEEVIETIAHELAHAVINSLCAEYDGEKGGGHGKFHDDIQERMEKMIEKSDEYHEFKAWWDKKKKK